MKALITKKIGMTSTVDENGVLTPVTILSVEDNVVTQIKSVETDGYNALQVGMGSGKNLGKSLLGHLKNSKVTPKTLREFRVDELPEDVKVGDTISLDVFEPGDKIDVTGTSKGKGWAGTIKRHNFHRGRKTHGGRSYRRPGSIGSMYPQKIFKGKKMAGQMGHVSVTTQNLRIAFVLPEEKVIAVTGAVPGPKKSIVIVKQAVKQ
ncbi:MAG: 50S ribosomal protein L3 [Patescibacteria group bacterium]